KKEAIDQLHTLLAGYTVYPEKMNPMLKAQETSPLSQPVKAKTLIPRPQLSIYNLLNADQELKNKAYGITSSPTTLRQVEIQIKYSGYIQKEFDMVQEMRQKEEMAIPETLNFDKIKSLS